LYSVQNFAAIKEAFDAVDSLQDLKLSPASLDDREHYQQLLFRQKNLRSLELNSITFDRFELKNWNIENLVLKSVNFVLPEAFQTFVSFIQSLDNISDLEIEILNGRSWNYNVILEHLLNLPSLTKLKWRFPVNAINIHNPSVKTFLIDTQTGSYSEILRNFPNIETLEFLSNKWSIDTNAVNSLENLRELKFNGMESWLLEQINCPKIHKFSVDGELSFRYSASWCKFFEKHQNIEHIELKARNVCKQYGSHFIQDFKNFPALKTLKNYDKIWSYHVKYIGDNLTSLEHLEVVVNESLVAEAVAYFQAKFPHLGCDSRKLQKRKDGAWDWLVSLRKF
jgi:hypothetical protein